MYSFYYYVFPNYIILGNIQYDTRVKEVRYESHYV
jgi:hypothetical protein